MASTSQQPNSLESGRKRAYSLYPLTIPSRSDRISSITAFREDNSDSKFDSNDDEDGDFHEADEKQRVLASGQTEVASFRTTGETKSLRTKSASISLIPYQPVPDLQISSKSRPEDTKVDFLTVLATQERHVLELREELQKAEYQLQGLKQHWANHEATKKRDESRHVHKLQHLNSNVAKHVDRVDDFDGSSAWMYEEMERRKAMIGHSRSSSRRVFSGSRHTRTLSLLANKSPTDSGSSGNSDQSDSNNQQSRHTEYSSIDTPSNQSPAIIERARRSTLFGNELPNLQHEHLMRTGRQVATGLKDGLWTLLEDIKQATVGDEARAVQANSSRKSLSRVNSGTKKKQEQPHSNGSSAKDVSEIDASFWRSNGVAEVSGKRASAATPQKVKLRSSVVDGEIWDVWDTPQDKASPAQSSNTYSPVQSQSSPTPSRSSPGTSRSSSVDEKEVRVGQNSIAKSRDAIPWPVLTKLAPGHLRRTASHLMEEWERSLVSPAEEDQKAPLQKEQDLSLTPTRAATLGVQMRFD